MAIVSFGDKRTERIYRGEAVTEFAADLCRQAKIRLDFIHAAPAVGALRFPPGNRLEKLRGDLQGWYSIRINKQWRIIFLWENDGARRVQVVDYHD